MSSPPHATDTRPDDALPEVTLTESERALLAHHLPLVHLQLRRYRWSAREASDGDDLFQEGCLALADAIRRHDPSRHGSFAPYAMARIHCRMGLWVAEQRTLIRVPHATQKRRRRRGEFDRHDPAGPAAASLAEYARQRRSARRAAEATSGPHEPAAAGPTLAERLRRRIEGAVAAAARYYVAGARRENSGEVVRRIVSERLMIPESEAQTPIRALVREMAVSIGRITHTEENLLGRVRRAMARDVEFRLLRRFASRRPNGWDEGLTPREAAQLRRAETKSQSGS